jgi:hypothetical protein
MSCASGGKPAPTFSQRDHSHLQSIVYDLGSDDDDRLPTGCSQPHTEIIFQELRRGTRRPISLERPSSKFAQFIMAGEFFWRHLRKGISMKDAAFQDISWYGEPSN